MNEKYLWESHHFLNSTRSQEFGEIPSRCSRGATEGEHSDTQIVSSFYLHYLYR